MTEVILVPLTIEDREQFISDNQEAFNYGALEEFGRRDNHFEEDEQIISRNTIEQSIDSGEAYRIMQGGQPVGGVVIKVDGEHGTLDLLFVSPKVHGKGIGYAEFSLVKIDLRLLVAEVETSRVESLFIENRKILLQSFEQSDVLVRRGYSLNRKENVKSRAGSF